MQIGYSGNYMRMRYTDSDNSVDFNFMDYKGSAKLRQGKWRPGKWPNTLLSNKYFRNLLH